MKQLNCYGLSEHDFDLMKDSIFKKYNKEPNDYDVIWNLFVKITLNMDDLQDLKLLYYQKAIFLHEEGQDCFEQLRQSAKCELMYLKQVGASKVKILSAGTLSCDACRNQDGQIYNINEALEKMPVPCKSCSFELYKSHGKPFCRCEYVAEFD